MLKRNVLLGGLIAGAFLLPTLAGAAVNGVCSNCHTMHNSQDGAAVAAGGPYNNLLSVTDCVGCHANAEENLATGLGDGAIGAPQVDNVTNGTSDGVANGFVLNAGYFADADNDNTHHNVVGIDATSDAAILANSATSPGGGFAVDNAGAPALTCQDCHSGSGAHHSATPSAYRILDGTNTTITNANFGAKAAAAGAIMGTRNTVIYQATNMNDLCANCHAGFHGNANQETAAGSGVWLRHPTDIQVTNSVDYPSIVTLLNNADTDNVVLGSTVATPTAGAATTDGTLMCLSCHLPHGSAYADLLSYDYSVVDAGDTSAATGGCEFCHSYGGNGM